MLPRRHGPNQPQRRPPPPHPPRPPRLGLNPRKIHVIERVPGREAFVELFRRGAPFQEGVKECTDTMAGGLPAAMAASMAAPIAARTHQRFAESTLIQALASWSQTRLSSTARITAAAPRTAQRTHQCLPRAAGPLPARAELTGVSWVTIFSVTAKGASVAVRRGMSESDG